MASNLLWIPARNGFSVAVAAGAALTTQLTYTPPAGVYARLKHVVLSMNGAAAAVVDTGLVRARISVDATYGLSIIAFIRAAGGAIGSQIFLPCDIMLMETSTLIIETVGATGAAMTMNGSYIVEQFSP